MIKSILALIFIALLAGNTQALELEVGIGYTMTANPTNGYWYQDGFDHEINSDSPSAHIGLVFHATDNLYLRFGYKYMGEFSSDAMASSSDENYAQWQNGQAEIWPLARWEGSTIAANGLNASVFGEGGGTAIVTGASGDFAGGAGFAGVVIAEEFF